MEFLEGELDFSLLRPLFEGAKCYFMCTRPIFINNQKYKGYVPCGKCVECIEKKSTEWKFRAEQEYKSCLSSFFVTLTYRNESLPVKDGIPVLCKRDVQLFMKRLRKIYSNYGKIRYFLLGEYGPTTLRPHYHALLFFDFWVRDEYSFSQLLAKVWQNGFVTSSPVNFNRIGYTVGYMCPLAELSDFYKAYPPFHLQSVGFGRNYLTEERRLFYKNLLLDNPNNPPTPYCFLQGKYRLTLPRYYKDRIYDLAEKSQIRHNVSLEQERLRKEKERNFVENRRRLWFNFLNTFDYEEWRKEFFSEISELAVDRAIRLDKEERRRSKMIKKRKL
ncbi:replication initiator protein [Sigmofec virus UA08Rod_6396]|uniref:Replication initiator protein n=1 Tax=Sigmofec virus UA08Rod_6396 TaxID=2929227 RepID=A0A976N0E8_9VIRU|nr:replication initiator protein [Sigmofec virus UA08Rod_6396]